MATNVKAASLVEDLELWPREQLDTGNVSGIRMAMEVGAHMPPVIVDKETNRIVDGFHRRRAALKAFGPEAEVSVEYRDFKDEAELYEEAVALNSTHGTKLTPYDHARIALKCRELGIPVEKLAILIHRSPEYVEKRHFAIRVLPSGRHEQVALKRGMYSLADTVLDEESYAANARSDGKGLGFHVKRVLEALEARVPVTEETLADLRRLKELIP